MSVPLLTVPCRRRLELLEDTPIGDVPGPFELNVFHQAAVSDRKVVPLIPLRTSAHHMVYGVLRTSV